MSGIEEGHRLLVELQETFQREERRFRIFIALLFLGLGFAIGAVARGGL